MGVQKNKGEVPSREELESYVYRLGYVPSRRDVCHYFCIKDRAQKEIIKDLLRHIKKEYGARERSKKREPSSRDEVGLDSILVGQVVRTDWGVRFIPTTKRTKLQFGIKNTQKIEDRYTSNAMMRARVESVHPPVVSLVDKIEGAERVSLISALSFDLPMVFPEAALADCQGLTVPPLNQREDVRGLSLVTIDGADARDFDDAVWAEPDADPQNPGGWHLVVAIADVSHYVPLGSALDEEALNRGTSAYFPDRVIPMLPEALSNELCSLKPMEDRACVGVHVWISSLGQKKRHRFFRGLMRSTARLTYEQAQSIYDGDLTSSEAEKSVQNLYGAYHALLEARMARSPLDVDAMDHDVMLDEQGCVREFILNERKDSHKLIEEFMILSNVAAAETLTEHHMPTLYRVHDGPDPEKIKELRHTLRAFKMAANVSLESPGDFTKLLHAVRDKPYQNIIKEMVMRCQSQAIYAPTNIGHFGLNLTHYCHFTSPIRRYPDLVVHRGLLKILGYSEEGRLPETPPMDVLGREASQRERRAEGAERDALDRYRVQYFASRMGERFLGYVSGMNKAGLFVTLNETGASGLVPMAHLGNDYYTYRENPIRLEGRRFKKAFRLGDKIKVKLLEADTIKGRLLMGLDS